MGEVETLTSEAMLFDEIATMASGRVQFVIGIDGMNGVGKTTLAEKLATKFKAKRISLDDFLSSKMGAYVDFICCTEVCKALMSASPLVVIEGICFRKIQKKCSFCVDIHIYVRRVGKNGIWQDDDICLALQSRAVLKRKEQEYLAFGNANSKQADLGLPRQLIDYHAEYLPVKKANIVFDVIM